MDMKSGNKNTSEMAERTLFDTIGDELRRARTSKNLSIEKAAEALNIRPIYIEALENNKTDAFPAPVYGVAFLRPMPIIWVWKVMFLCDNIKKKMFFCQICQPIFPFTVKQKLFPISVF